MVGAKDDTRPDLNYSLGFCVSAIEVNLAIITASGPAIWPLVRSWMPRIFSTMSLSNGGYHQNNEINWTPNGTTRRNAYANTSSRVGDSINGTNNIHVTSNNIPMKDLKEMRATGHSPTDSDEEILTQSVTGILRVTDFSVTHDDDSRHNDSGFSDSAKRSSGRSLY